MLANSTIRLRYKWRVSRYGRIGVIVIAGLALGAVLVAGRPIPQPETYHRFADGRTLWGVPSALNVLSNLPFLAVGLLGFIFLARDSASAPRITDDAQGQLPKLEKPAYAVFFAGVLLTAFGSSYYHLAPSTERLFWDRLPMSVAFSALVATVIAERISVKWSRILLLPFVIAGVASVIVWHLSEQRGSGDMRFYIFIQGFPMLALPMMMLLFSSRYTNPKWLWLMILLYAAAKVTEVLDVQIWDAFGRVVSGHSLKHLLAAGATYSVLVMLGRRALRTESASIPKGFSSFGRARS